jgi:hypothetical protein
MGREDPGFPLRGMPHSESQNFAVDPELLAAGVPVCHNTEL